MTTILKENTIWKFVNSVVTKPFDLDELDVYEIPEARAQRIILHGVKDHLIPHLVEKKTAKDMWDTLKNLYEAKNENRKMVLCDKLQC